jgi:hypothetical protein
MFARKKGVSRAMVGVKMRHVAIAVLAIALNGVPAFPQQPGTSQPAQATELSAVLDTWVHNSTQIKSLSARFSRKDKRHNLLLTGEYSYEALWRDSGQAALKIAALDRKGTSELLQRIIWTRREVWQYFPQTKGIMVWTLDDYRIASEGIREAENILWVRLMGIPFDLALPALGNPRVDDPLAFLVGMKETVAKKLFKFELLADSDPNQYVVRATPLDPKLKSYWNDILIMLDRERHLPIAVVYRKGWKGRDTREYKFLDVKLDPPIADSSFEPAKLKGWQIIRPDEKDRNAK